MLTADCEIMAVIKGNAYGHGAGLIAKELNRLGVFSFAVAALPEALELREHDIQGSILILGYTHPQNAGLLEHFDLTQAVVDYNYARQLSNYGAKIKAQVKIDTGMHRIGEDYHNIDNLKRIFALDNLDIEGTFSHFCVSDILDEESRQFTRQQIDNFDYALDALRKAGFNPGKCHIQASYGLLNYPDLTYDHVRIGTIIFGVPAEDGLVADTELDLKPVLSLRARVTSVRELAIGETVSYGRTFTATRKTTVASVAIGYADGYPRILSGGKGFVLIHGQYAPIAGRVCMDQLIVDVTDITAVKPGDIVTLIGEDGDNRIAAEEVAGGAGFLVPELLSGLGHRLQRYYVD